jgi:hypothetical protein
MWMVEQAKHFDFSLHFVKDSLLLYFLLIEDFDGHFMTGDLMIGHYTH